MHLAFGLPLLGVNTANTPALPPASLMAPPALERIVPARALPSPVRPSFLSANIPGMAPSDLRKVIAADLPKSLLPFPTKTNIREDLKPLGAVETRNAREAWLKGQLQEIYEANSVLFEGLKPEDIRLTYDPDISRMASVDLEGLEITFGPKAFELTQDHEALTAILCHELSHILLGHHSFKTPFPAWVQDHPLVADAQAKQSELRDRIDVHSVAERYQGLASAEESLRAQMVQAGEIQAPGQATVDMVEAFAKGLGSKSEVGQSYLRLRQAENEYQAQVAAWQAAVKDEKLAADVVFGEPGAASNWTEEQADLLGFRLFLSRGGRPEDFINALVRTLARKDPGLKDYVQGLFSAKDLRQVQPPARSDADHPTGRWRVYNLLVRELHLRYPAAYRQLLKRANPLFKGLS